MIALNEWHHESSEKTQRKGSDPLTAEEIKKIERATLTFETIVLSELPEANIYYVTPKRGYDMTILFNRGEALLSAQAIESLGSSSTKARDDVRYAARCLASDLYTACGFHAFRALESVVLMYLPVLKITPPSNNKRNLGVYIQLLEGKDEKGKDRDGAHKVKPEIIVMLRGLKDFYRNPLIHPEISLEEEEAEGSLQLVISAISIMTKDIAEWEEKLSSD
jgi:hypothetical protein